MPLESATAFACVSLVCACIYDTSSTLEKGFRSSANTLQGEALPAQDVRMQVSALSIEPAASVCIENSDSKHFRPAQRSHEHCSLSKKIVLSHSSFAPSSQRHCVLIRKAAFSFEEGLAQDRKYWLAVLSANYVVHCLVSHDAAAEQLKTQGVCSNSCPSLSTCPTEGQQQTCISA